ncbi:MAG: protein-disulfide reductase DsbD family protein [Paracoccaceae bacterium]|nr:protein-disulfide reductase DsbD family protein [Paracoccaceae bacterium]
MRLLRALCLALLALAAPFPAAAGDFGDVAEVTVLPGWRTPQGTHMAALRIRLAPGWKTYWRAPGDAGIPPRFSWEGSRNLAAVRFHWPRPEVHEINGMRSIGYHGELVLPMEFTPASPGEPIRLRAEVEIGVCQEICVPLQAEIAAELVPGGGPDPAITAALAARPATAREAGVAAVSCDIEPIRDGLRLTARIDMPPLGPEEVAVFELSDQSIWISEATGRREGRRLTAASDMVPPSGAPFLLDRSEVRITVLGRGRAVELSGCPSG